jgi:formylglycine-generating enzyme required for sulfatase activity
MTIEQLVATLEQNVKDLTAEEIADILWLTHQQWQSASSKTDTTQSGGITSDRSEVKTSSTGNTQPIPLPIGNPASTNGVSKDKTTGITTRQPQKGIESPNSSLDAPLAIPDSPSLRRSLDILRAIRPLIRLVPSIEATYLDVPATVKAIAETDLWLLKLRPVMEPWLELALVVDATPSMVIWQRTILNLRRVLAQSGVFRDVRLWSLETLDFTENVPDTSGQKIAQGLCVRSGFGAATASQPPCRPQELLDPNGRRLILLVSDCIDPRWDAQPIRDLLQVWAKQSPIGLVQVLPEWLWSRTALCQVTKGQMLGLRPGQPSQTLTFVRRHRSLPTTPVGVKIPVMTLEPAVTNRWSQMVAGKSSVSSPGLIFSPVSVQEFFADSEFDSQESAEATPQERLAQFREYSSPMARQLVGLLAACPEVNLPVVRMVQAALLPDSQQVHVAEVLLGGLFKSQTEITAYTPADRVQYVFHEGVKPLVQETISPQQSFKALSAWVKRRFGYALEDFPAFLTETQSEEIKPFAGVMLDVLNRQSSRHTDLIDRVGELSGTDPTVEIDSTKQDLDWSNFPELKELNFTTAQLVEAVTKTWPPPLQSEEYTVATITFNSPDKSTLEPELFTFKVGTLVSLTTRSGHTWEVQKSDAQAYRYVEQVDENVTLEMVGIAGGDFMMGSPAEDSQGHDRERPQHLVTVPDLYLGRYPVTQAQWRSIAAMPQFERELELDPSEFKGGNRPVENVSWHDAIEFCARLSKQTKTQYRLPTEAEWEYACRAGTTTPFHFGETISTELANYNGSAYADGPTGNGRGETTPVDHFEIANDWGLCDMHGNVLEWCEDHWHDNYDGAPNDGSAWLTDNADAPRVYSGGSWLNYPRDCRSASRYVNYPTGRNYNVGFRLACAAPGLL